MWNLDWDRFWSIERYHTKSIERYHTKSINVTNIQISTKIQISKLFY